MSGIACLAIPAALIVLFIFVKVLFKNNDNDQARIRQRKPEQKVVDESLSINNTGIALINQGDYEKAITIYSDALQHYRKNNYICINLANAYYYDKQFNKSYEFYMKAIENDSKDYIALYNVAHCCCARGFYDIAAEYFDKSIQFNSLLTDAYFYSGLCHYKACNYDRAIERFHHYLHFASSNKYAYYYLILVLIRKFHRI